MGHAPFNGSRPFCYMCKQIYLTNSITSANDFYKQLKRYMMLLYLCMEGNEETTSEIQTSDNQTLTEEMIL